MRSISLITLLWLLKAVSASFFPQAPLGTFAGIQQDFTPGKRGAVASENSICSKIGVDLIAIGGNAADAMVGTVFCVGTISSYHSGIGGGGFAVIRAPNGSYEFIDFREAAPAAAYEDMYKANKNLSVFGGLAVGVPGEVRGLARLHESYGKLPWKVVMQGAINVARNGFPVNPDLVRYMKYVSNGAPDPGFLVNDPNWATDFAPNGTLLQLGDTMTRKRYADTLETLAEQGPEAFYSGPIAESMVAALRKSGGSMTLEDLQNYRAINRKVANVTYRGYKIFGCSAPCGGEIMMSAFNILSGYDDFFQPGTANLSTHRLDEAFRFAYGQRTEFADPLFVTNLSDLQSKILLPSTGASIRAKISDYHTLNVSDYDPSGVESLEDHGTSHISTADSSGLAISLTTTVNLLFGSLDLIPETGIIMNNEMNDFSIPGVSNEFGFVPSPNNYVRPGKRPLSSLTPAIVEHADGSVYFVTGAAGGSRIITATAQAIINVLDRNMTTLQALREARLHDQLIPNRVVFEDFFDNATIASMAEKGHNVTWTNRVLSDVHGVRVLADGTFEAAGDPRLLDASGHTI